MEPNSPRKIQFTVPLLEPHLDPEAAEQVQRQACDLVKDKAGQNGLDHGLLGTSVCCYKYAAGKLELAMDSPDILGSGIANAVRGE
ncbi:hypothetical protein E2320_016386 [Naja naja]|nr:hypothetical protein E2320_016386 [Naja naja]